MLCNPLARRGLLCLLLAAAGSALPAGSAHSVEFVISWLEVQHEVRPRQAVWKVRKTVRLTLEGGNAISEATTATGSSGRTVGFVGEGKLREQMSRGRSQASWRVQDEHTLVRTASRPQHTEIMEVSVTGQNTCAAKLSYHLKPGFNEYMMRSIRNRQPLYFDAVSAENIVCKAAE
jgi:hypothetical protein